MCKIAGRFPTRPGIRVAARIVMGRLWQPGSWGVWWRERVPFEQKAAIVALGLGGLLVGGWLAADSLSAASAGVGLTTTHAVAIRTVDELVTVRRAAKPVTTRVSVVKRVYVTRRRRVPAATVVQTETAYGTRTVIAPAYITRTVTGPARTVTQLLTTTTVATTVQWHVITVVEKSPPVTVTVTAPGQ
jgi:hypothetical protein